MKLLPILLLFTAISWHLAWNETGQTPNYVEVWNGNEQLEVTSSSIELEGVWHWWAIVEGKVVGYMSF